MLSASAGLRLLVVLCICFVGRSLSWKGRERRKLSSFAAPGKHNGGAVERIVGGEVVEDPKRYPYMVLIYGNSKCTGTLIASDIILTAAHCFSVGFDPGVALVGAYNLTDTSEETEQHVFQDFAIHPHYYEPMLSADFDEAHDYALIKIFDISGVGSPIRINRDATVPDTTPNVPLHVLGWGRTNFSDRDSDSDVLREADVNFIPNEQCKQISTTYYGSTYSLENKIFKTSLCAADFIDREDTCQGDSGGPIFLRGQDASDDVQLGITSTGLGCAHHEVPAIYARISYVYDWIRDFVCLRSLNPPADFECDPSRSSTEPDLSGEPVEVTLQFVTDSFANEVGWIVQSPNEDGVAVTYAYKAIGTYPKGPNRGQRFSFVENFSIPNNRYYLLTIFDAYGDGYDEGDSPFTLNVSANDDIILDESLVFANYSISFEFVVGALPTASPTVTPSPTTTMPPSMAPTMTPPTIWIVIVFDLRPEETGWRIEALHESGEVEKLFEVYPGTYNNMASIREPFRLLSETPMKYRFTVTDNEANGICCDYGIGSYQLWLGEADEGTLLAEGEDFVFEASHEFLVDATSTESESISATSASSIELAFGLMTAVLLWSAIAFV